MKRITGAKVITTIDDNPDLSFLGEFSRKPLYRHKNEAWIPTDPDNMKHTIWFSPCNHLPHKDPWVLFKAKSILKYHNDKMD